MPKTEYHIHAVVDDTQPMGLRYTLEQVNSEVRRVLERELQLEVKELSVEVRPSGKQK